MEKRLNVRTYSGPSITALAYQPVRREVIVGFEDGILRCWEVDTEKPAGTYHHHKGWITDLFYWTEGKVLFSSSIDYTIVQWSSSFIPYHTVLLNGPVYSLLWSPRKEQLICGRDGYVGVLQTMGKVASNGLPIMSYKEIRIEGHTGIVKCLASSGNKVYSGGFDQKLIVYEASSMPVGHTPPLRCLHVNHRAHDAGITCIVVAKDDDSSTWLATGSFDQRTKIWTADGKPLLSIPCSASVTGLTYLPQMKVLWVAAGTQLVNFYEPKLGANISDYIPVLGEKVTGGKNRDRSCTVQLLKYAPDINEVIGSTNRKELLSWRYNTNCSYCIQRSPSLAHIETITYTSKVPILIFTGSYNGEVMKWERLQLNAFVYSTDPMTYKDKLSSHLQEEEGDWNLLEVAGMAEETEQITERMGNLNLLEKRAIVAKKKETARKEIMKDEYRGFVKSLFVETLDYLVISSLDGKIFVWGFDKKTVAVLREMQGKTKSHLGQENGDAAAAEKDSITSRVAGFTCLQVLNGHSGVVSGLALAETNDHVYLISAGWDSVVCVWDLKISKLLCRMKPNSVSSAATTPASSTTDLFPRDNIITDIDFCKERNLFAFSLDKFAYVHQFSTKKQGMKLVATLSGHFSEVTQVKWNSFMKKWVTASEDGTIRTWAPEGGDDCEQFVRIGQPVSLLTIDKTHGSILAATNDVIRIYDHHLELIQVSRGHEDCIRDIVHIPELDQYLSTAWDNTIRIWKAHHPKGSQHAAATQPTSLAT